MILSPVFGCLAPLWVIQLSYWLAYAWLAVSCVATAACLMVESRRRSFRWAPVYAALLALQPGWEFLYQWFIRQNFNVRADCGYPARAQSLFLAAVSVAVAVIISRRLPVSRRSFAFGVAVALLLMSIADALYLFTPVRRIFPDSTWVEEIRSSVAEGVTLPWPHQIIVLGVLCVGLYYFRRLRLREAV